MRQETFLERLARRALIGDGATGTMLYQQGVFLNTCFDELNLSRADLVEQIHRAYVEVGVDFIETNTFGANQFKLAKFGLADKGDQINRRAVEIARQAVGDSEVLVAGAVGPAGPHLHPYGTLGAEDARAAFARQIGVLIEAGVDLLILETFSNPDELVLALDVVAQFDSVPTIAQLTTNEYQETAFGQGLAEAFDRVSRHDGATVVGLNCSIGPAIMLSSLELIKTVTAKPIAVQPNAGLPREIEGRRIYMCTPEYMAEYAKRFYEKGARVIGGCCGTTPAHIREIVRAVGAMDKPTASRRAAPRPASASVAVAEPAAPVALAEKSALAAKLAAGEKVVTIEITPPRGADLAGIIEKARLCAELGVDAINIPDGPRASSRVSPMITALQIQEQAHIESLLHVCCRDRNIIGLQSDMLGAHAVGLRNLLIVTGDPPKLGEYPDATAVYDVDAISLTAVVHDLNRGLDIGGNSFTPPLAMVVGVGANPVATDMDREIERFGRKVEAGAEFAITQPVFDPDALCRFLEAIEPYRIPIIAGIWPFTSYKNAEFMANEVPGVVVPARLLERMAPAQTREQARRCGVDIAREMIDTIESYVDGFAVSAPFGNVRTALAVLQKIEVNEI